MWSGRIWRRTVWKTLSMYYFRYGWCTALDGWVFLGDEEGFVSLTERACSSNSVALTAIPQLLWYPAPPAPNVSYTVRRDTIVMNNETNPLHFFHFQTGTTTSRGT